MTTNRKTFAPTLDRRLERLAAVNEAVKALALPILRVRKLNGILNALIMQIEGGGDSAEVNGFLIQALRAAILAQAGAESGHAALEALERFEQAEAQSSPAMSPRRSFEVPDVISAINQLIDDGQNALLENDSRAACHLWLEAWQGVKRLVSPATPTRAHFRRANPAITSEFSNWCYDLMFELHNAGLSDTHEARIAYIHEFLNIFPAENDDDDIVLNFGRGEGEALWELGRIAESEAVYAALVERLPDEAWAYIGWADQYWIMNDSSKDYSRGEALLQRALQRPQLKDRVDVLERLVMLYGEWGKPRESEAIERQLAALRNKPRDAQRLPPKAAPAGRRHRKKKK